MNFAYVHTVSPRLWWGWGEAEGRRSEVGPCPTCVAYVVVFIGSTFICTIYKLSIAEQSQVILQLTVSLCDLL